MSFFFLVECGSLAIGCMGHRHYDRLHSASSSSSRTASEEVLQPRTWHCASSTYLSLSRAPSLCALIPPTCTMIHLLTWPPRRLHCACSNVACESRKYRSPAERCERSSASEQERERERERERGRGRTRARASEREPNNRKHGRKSDATREVWGW